MLRVNYKINYYVLSFTLPLIYSPNAQVHLFLITTKLPTSCEPAGISEERLSEEYGSNSQGVHSGFNSLGHWEESIRRLQETKL